MSSKDIVFSLLVIFHIFYAKCNIIKDKSDFFFKVQDAYYQSWVTRKNEKGTNIIMQLVQVHQEVRFDSIVFRGIQMPVFTSEKGGVVTLKSILVLDISKIPIVKKFVDKPDQLVYHYKGNLYVYPLKNIRRLKTKYF